MVTRAMVRCAMAVVALLIAFALMDGAAAAATIEQPIPTGFTAATPSAVINPGEAITT
jgi:hypothetical protein